MVDRKGGEPFACFSSPHTGETGGHPWPLATSTTARSPMPISLSHLSCAPPCGAGRTHHRPTGTPHHPLASRSWDVWPPTLGWAPRPSWTPWFNPSSPAIPRGDRVNAVPCRLHFNVPPMQTEATNVQISVLPAACGRRLRAPMALGRVSCRRSHLNKLVVVKRERLAHTCR